MKPEASESETRIRSLVLAGDLKSAADLVVRSLGPEVLGFLRASLGRQEDADEVFSATSVRLWKGLASFHWECSLRTWAYTIARNEAARFLQGARRHKQGRASSSALEQIVAVVRTATLSALRSEKRGKLQALREELSVEDRMLLILRVDRGLGWEAVARAFLPESAGGSAEQVKREAARLRKRFQLVRQRLAERARTEGLLS